MKVTDSVFVSNRAEFKGGALYSSKQMTVINSCFLSNRTYNYKGAAVYTASSLIAVNSTFQGNKAISDNNRNYGGVYSTLSGYLYHCTLANDGNVSPVSDRSLFLYNSIITGTNKPWLNSVNGSISGGANIIRDSSGQPTYAEMFGTNPVTHNYLMPLPSAPNIKAAPVITDIQIPEGANKAEILALLKTDAAGAPRGTESCTFGAVEATAVAFEVTNRNPDGTGSLYAATITADGYTATPAPDKRIIHFNESADGEIVVDKRIHTGFPTVISGRVDSKGNKTISLAAPEESKLPVVTNEGTFNLTIYNLSLAGGGYSTVFGGRSLTMEGCTVSGGTKTGSGQFGQYGHGGGIYSEGTVTISNSVISESSASDSGGGIYAKGNVNLRYSKIINNTAAKAGGGVYTEGKVTAEDCVFEGNTSQNTGSEGGGALFSNGAFLEDCVFQNNRADYAGGAIHGKNDSTFTALNTVFNKNTSEEIGAIYLSRGTLNMVNCIMTENSATGSDFHYGGIYTSRGTIRLFQTTIADNSGYGVHVNLASGSLHLYNSIVAGNESPDVSPVDRVFTGTSLVGGKNDVTREFVFGTNTTAPSGFLRIMAGGFGHSKADVLTAADLTATGITDETECNLILAALAKDAIGVARSASGKVSYGALETPADKYATLTVKTPPNKTTYSFNESVNYSTALDGGVLRYAFLGGGGGTLPMTDPLVTNNMEERLITSSAGNKSVTFTYLGKSVGQVFVVSKGTQESFSIKEGNLVKSVGDPVFSLTAEGGTGTSFKSQQAIILPLH